MKNKIVKRQVKKPKPIISLETKILRLQNKTLSQENKIFKLEQKVLHLEAENNRLKIEKQPRPTMSIETLERLQKVVGHDFKHDSEPPEK